MYTWNKYQIITQLLLGICYVGSKNSLIRCKSINELDLLNKIAIAYETAFHLSSYCVIYEWTSE